MGKTKEETKAAIKKYKSGWRPVVIPGTDLPSPTLKDVEGSYLYKGGQEVKREVLEAGERVAEEPTLIGKTAELGMGLAGVTAETLKTAFAPIGMGIQKASDKISDIGAVQDIASNETVGKGLDALTNIVGNIFQNWTEFSQKNPRLAQGIGDNAEILLAIMGEKPAQVAVEGAGQALKAGIETSGSFMKGLAEQVAKGTMKYGDDMLSKTEGLIDGAKLSMFGRKSAANTIDDIVKVADTAATVRAKSEGVTGMPSISERLAGVPETFKNRFKGKPEIVKEYFDVAHARNSYDTLPTPLEYAVNKSVIPAQTKIEALLNDTGSEIGAFRKKIATYQANIDQVKSIENKFLNELEKLNLEVRNGEIVKKPGTITRVSAESEIKVLNDLYSELQTFKEGPSLEKVIDLRNNFDRKINFEKEARDISNTLDPLSKTVRKQIADEAANVVGKSEATKLQEYSSLIEALYDLKSYTDRKSGAEFLLRQALSNRGRMPKEVMDVVKKYTGIDLMDHAVMSSLATDLIGGADQKGLFRQEITKAGLDAYAAITGSPTGILNTIENIAKKTLIDQEKVFIEAVK